jgi:hypothetical protein
VGWDSRINLLVSYFGILLIPPLITNTGICEFGQGRGRRRYPRELKVIEPRKFISHFKVKWDEAVGAQS